MSFIVSESNGDFKIVPEGTHLAICNLIVNLGLQNGGNYGPKRKVYLRWEVPSEQGAMVGKYYTRGLTPMSNLRKDLESWRGHTFSATELAGFDISDFLGKACMVNVAHRVTPERTYANVVAVMALPRDALVPEATSDLILYDVDEHDPDMFELLPQFLKKAAGNRIKEQPAPKAADDFDDDIP